MTFRTVLLAPWRSSHAALRWLMLIVLAICIVAGIAIAIFASKPKALWGGVVFYGAGLGYAWAFFLSSLTLLAIDAHQLRLPGMQRAAALAMLTYGVLSVLPATLLYGLAGGDMPAIALLLMLCVLVGLCFALLPRYFAMLIGLMPALHNATASSLPIPGPSDPRFLSWAPVAVVVLLATCALRWRTLMNQSGPSANSFSDAMVLAYRRSAWGSGWACTNGMDSTQQVRQRPDWMQPKADLRHAGPQQPRMALRVALGGWYLPKTMMGHLQAWGPTLLAMLVPLAVLSLIFYNSHALVGKLWRIALVISVGWGSMWGAFGMTIMSVMLLTQRWRRVNTELSLLVLLPGLGDATAVKTKLLRVALMRPLCIQAVLTLVLVALAVYAHATGASLLLLVISQLGCAATLIACLLGVLGGRPLPGWGLTVLITLIAMLIGCISSFSGSMIGDQAWAPSTSFVVAVIGAWLVMGAVLAWLGRRGWRGLIKRPHPFLPNGT
ncbi:hypothetical protein [Dyella sp. 20L07]|uniref:hypothetical protein n=1 Tax=Dyella sp. 20L07 TaxID=3384240 RepID=UPI003D29B635